MQLLLAQHGCCKQVTCKSIQEPFPLSSDQQVAWTTLLGMQSCIQYHIIYLHSMHCSVATKLHVANELASVY